MMMMSPECDGWTDKYCRSIYSACKASFAARCKTNATRSRMQIVLTPDLSGAFDVTVTVASEYHSLVK